MILSLKDFLLTNYNINGDIILYRDEDHRKKKMCEYLAQVKGIPEGQDIHIYSDGAYALYMAKAFPNNKIISHYSVISPDYGDAMVQQENLELVSGFSRYEWNKLVDDNLDWFVIDQYTDTDITEYYKSYFSTIVEAVKDYHIDAFCEYSHTGQTLRGFIESELVDWKVILGQIQIINNEPRRNLIPYIDKLDTVDVAKFKTFKLCQEIESLHPEFGNIYEATRSISGAMTWLQNNPNKTVLVYVGDEFNRITDKFNNSSLSQIFETESYMLTHILDYLIKTNTYDIPAIKEYISFLCEHYNSEYLYSCLGFLFNLIITRSNCSIRDSIYDEQLMYVCQNLLNIDDDVLTLTRLVLKNDIYTEEELDNQLRKQLTTINDLSKVDPFIVFWALSILKRLNKSSIDEELYSNIKLKIDDCNFYRKSIGLVGVL